jgi:hypothetical protein
VSQLARTAGRRTTREFGTLRWQAKPLKGLGRLSCLDVRGTRVTDAGLVHLKGLTSLSRLGLDGTQVTDAGVRELREALPSLTILH